MIVLGLGALAIAVGTMVTGWAAVPAMGLVVGLTRPCDRPVLTGMGAGALAWGVLLLWGLTRGPVSELAEVLGGVLGLPGAVVVVITLLFPAVLAGAAAGLGSAVRAMGSEPSA